MHCESKMSINDKYHITLLFRAIFLFVSFCISLPANCDVNCYETVDELSNSLKFHGVFGDEFEASEENKNLLTKKFAVVLGINNYSQPINPLVNAVADAVKVSEALDNQAAGYEVICLKNITQNDFNNLYNLLDNLLNNRKIVKKNLSLEERSESEIDFIFYYAGHGYSSGRDNYMVFSNKVGLQNQQQTSLEDALKENSTSLRSIYSLLNNRDRGLFQPVIFFDGCRKKFELSDQTIKNFPNTEENELEGDIVTFFSTSGNSSASDGVGDYSGPFAKIFSNVFFGSKINTLTYREVFNRIQQLFKNINDNNQIPAFQDRYIKPIAKFSHKKNTLGEQCDYIQLVMGKYSINPESCRPIEPLVEICQQQNPSFFSSKADLDDCPLPWAKPFVPCSMTIKEDFDRICEENERNSIDTGNNRASESSEYSISEIPSGNTAKSERERRSSWTFDERQATAITDNVKIFSDNKLTNTVDEIYSGSTVVLENPDKDYQQGASVPILYVCSPILEDCTDTPTIKRGFVKKDSIKSLKKEFSFIMTTLDYSEKDLNNLKLWVETLNNDDNEVLSTIRITVTRSGMSDSEQDMKIIRSEAFVYGIYIKSLLKSLGVASSNILLEYEAKSNSGESSNTKVVLTCIRSCESKG
jgi:hypothetical protein